MADQRVVAAVARRGDRWLVCQRPTHKRHGGLWEFPGGKTHDGEADDAAVARELREELGVVLQRSSPAEFEAADPDSPFVIAFVPVVIDGNPVCTEHADYAWATMDELRALPLAPSDARYVEWILATGSANGA